MSRARLTRRVAIVAPWLLAALAGPSAAGCGGRRASPAATDLDVGIVGCAAIRRSTQPGPPRPVCELGKPVTVRLVLPPGATDVKIGAWRGDAGAPEIAPVAPISPDERTLFAIDAAPGHRSIVVEATVGGAPGRREIEIATAEPRPWLDEARRLKAEGNLDRAAAITAEKESASSLVDRAIAKGYSARIALARGRSDEAFPRLREAIALHREAGRVSDVVNDSFTLAFALHQKSQRYTEARAALDDVAGDLALYPEGRARDPYYRGLLAEETGDHRRALTLLRDAEQKARRLRMTRLERDARSGLAVQMQEVGRARASLPILAALEAELDEAARPDRPSVRGADAEAPDPCERVSAANNRGWAALLVNEVAAAQGDPPPEDVRAPLERALAITGCPDVYLRAAALTNLTRLALDEGKLDAAEQRLAEAREGVKEPRGTDRLEWIELEARLALARGRPRDALKGLDEGLAFARAAVLRREEWSLLVARAEVLSAEGRQPDAIASLRAAEDVLEDATLLVPLGEGRSAFAGGRSRSARALVGMLVAAGKIEDAVKVGRRAQARVLASVEGALRLEQLAPAERARWEEAVRAFRAARGAIDSAAADDWKLPADALARAVEARARRERDLRAALEGAMAVLARPPPPAPATAEAAPGVLEIDVLPDVRGFVALVTSARRSVARRVPSPRGMIGAELARALLDPIDAELAASVLVRIRAYGAWRTVDVHALPWRGEPLIAHVPVEYAIGVGAQRLAPPGGGTVVVGDPTSDLPGAFEEAQSTARALERARGGAVRLLVRDAATSGAVIDALRGAAELHYAGHGIFAGDEGWESALPLAAGGRLTVGDVLALTPAPRTVVLTGCEAAKSVGEAEGLGLAQAFLVAGAGEVLAPVRPVADVLASRLAAALYPAPDAATAAAERRVVGRARAAILAVRSADPSSDWASFRVLVP